MGNEDRSSADQVAADIQAAVDTILDQAKTTRLRAAMSRDQRLEFLIQQAQHEAQIQEHEGNKDLAELLYRVAEELRVLKPKVVAQGGDIG